jgi:hypothetical protein
MTPKRLAYHLQLWFTEDQGYSFGVKMVLRGKTNKGDLMISKSFKKWILGGLVALVASGTFFTSFNATASDDISLILDIVDRVSPPYGRDRDRDRDRDRRDRPRPPRYGNLICSAVDRGFEEHRAHLSCRDCLRHHGECIETCEEQTTFCRGVGINRYGRAVEVAGSGADRWEAEDEVLYECRLSRLSQCRITECFLDSRTVSRRSCR